MTDFPKTFKAIRDNFPGRSNAGLRAKLRSAVESGTDVSGFARTVALTIWGRISLSEVARAQREEDPQWQLFDVDGNPV